MFRTLTTLLILTGLLQILPVQSLPIKEAGISQDAYFWRGVYMCSKPNFQGECHWHHFEPDVRDKCVHVEIPGDSDVLPIASVGPDWGLGITMYSTPDCSGKKITNAMACPGMPSMRGFWDINQPMRELYMMASDMNAAQQPHAGYGGEMMHCAGSPVPWKRDLEEARAKSIEQIKKPKV
jgi:hypothetical protein